MMALIQLKNVGSVLIYIGFALFVMGFVFEPFMALIRSLGNRLRQRKP